MAAGVVGERANSAYDKGNTGSARYNNRVGGTAVADLIIQPTLKFIKAGTIAVAVVFLALELACLISWNAKSTALIMIAPPLLFLWPLKHWVRRRLTKTTISGDRLRFETGIASRTTRNIQVSKIQDVRVEQSVHQRVFNVGDLSIETAGESSRLTVHNVDDPQALADELLNRSQKGGN
jgi:uncharacterized membrane protein YdbT with pleckstrin-like domain